MYNLQALIMARQARVRNAHVEYDAENMLKICQKNVFFFLHEKNVFFMHIFRICHIGR